MSSKSPVSSRVSAFLNSSGLTFDGTIGTIAFETVLFECDTGGTVITLPATLTVERRFRIIYSSFVVLSGETGINASTSATIPDEGYILDTVNFGGGGTYITGITTTDNKARISETRGIDNSGNIAQYYMNNNATATTITVSGTYVKVAGTTSSGTFVEKFTLTDNRATYDGALQGFYKVSAILSMTSGNNQDLTVRIAKNGTTSAQSATTVTTSGSGRSENVYCHDIVSLTSTDYIEIFVTNETSTNNITVEDMNVIIERLN